MATPRERQNSPQVAGEEESTQDTPIEPLRQDEAREDDEFLTTGWDATSTIASTSLASSVYKYEFENGRRYHSYKHGRYPIPNDDIEQNREDMKHAMIMELTDGKLFYSPIGDNPQKILDLGTGTGIWAMEVADSFPGAQVLGIDLSPIQPTWVPPNLRFIVDDIEDEWVNGSDWDFVHCRSMAVVLRNLDKVLNQIFTHIKPGGWIEFQESHGMPQCDDGTMKQDDVLANFYATCVKAMAKFGMDLDKAMAKFGMDLDKGSAPLGAVLAAAGFTNVRCVVKKAPLGTWARNKTLRLVGQYAKLALLDSLSSVMGKPFAALGYSEEEREVWAAKIRQTAHDDSVHRYYNVYFWFGQKPE